VKREVRKSILRASAVALLAVPLGVITGVAILTLTDLPEVNDLERYEPKSVTRLTDIRGRLIHEFYRERRIPLPFGKIPFRLRQALLASEDWRFYDHFGLDLRGLLRATLRNVRQRRYVEGASTITQQLAKVLFLSPDKTLRRKLKEAVLAIQIERRYSKNEILGLYLNQIYLGEGCYGVEAAARTYFGKSVSDLSISECAMLAALPKAPSVFSPFKNPERARERRDMVLREMFERNLITKADWRNAREEPLPQKPTDDPLAPSHFAAHVLREVSEQIGEEQVYRGYLNIESTLDLDLQRAAEGAVARGIAAYAERHNIPSGASERLPQAALLAVDAVSGEIRAMVGGTSFAQSQFNRTTQALRQPGSAFKPILYAAAIEQGYTQSTLLLDTPISFRNRESGRWEPKNYDNDYDGPIPLRRALERSKNVAAVRLLQSIGLPALTTMASRLGIVSPIAENLSSALGSSSLKLSELVRAYAAIDNNGFLPQIRSIRSVKTDADVDLWSISRPTQPAVDPRIAYVAVDLLTGVIRSGTGSFAREIPCPLAGKTGTTDDNVDSLFIGFDPHTVVGVWVGFDDRKSLGRNETGAVAAGPIWKEFMESACDRTMESFPPPDGIVMVDVDHSSGKRPGPYCTDVVSEAFLEGTEPTETCTEETME
jgi:penicillin-binding protein 1A